MHSRNRCVHRINSTSIDVNFASVALKNSNYVNRQLCSLRARELEDNVADPANRDARLVIGVCVVEFPRTEALRAIANTHTHKRPLDAVTHKRCRCVCVRIQSSGVQSACNVRRIGVRCGRRDVGPAFAFAWHRRSELLDDDDEMQRRIV